MSLGLPGILPVKNVRDCILSHLSGKQLIGLGKVCHATADAVALYVATAFDIDERLRRFFRNPTSFRRMQALTSTVISGSFALQYFNRTHCLSSFLDLCVYPHHRRTVGRWIVDAGYTFCPFPDQDQDFEAAVLRRHPPQTTHYSMPGVADIFTFQTNQADDASSSLKVQLIVAHRTPMEVILGFHSACLMNVISYEKAYCLFPLATVESGPSLLSGASRETVPLTFGTLSFAHGPRWLGDPDTWIIHLETTDISHPPPENQYSTAIARDPVALSSFSVRHHPAGGVTMAFSIVESSTLKYAYVFGDEDLVDHVSRVLTLKETESWRDTQAGLDSITYCDSDMPQICRDFVRRSLERKLSCLRILESSGRSM